MAWAMVSAMVWTMAAMGAMAAMAITADITNRLKFCNVGQRNI